MVKSNDTAVFIAINNSRINISLVSSGQNKTANYNRLTFKTNILDILPRLNQNGITVFRFVDPSLDGFKIVGDVEDF